MRIRRRDRRAADSRGSRFPQHGAGHRREPRVAVAVNATDGGTVFLWLAGVMAVLTPTNNRGFERRRGTRRARRESNSPRRRRGSGVIRRACSRCCRRSVCAPAIRSCRTRAACDGRRHPGDVVGAPEGIVFFRQLCRPARPRGRCDANQRCQPRRGLHQCFDSRPRWLKVRRTVPIRIARRGTASILFLPVYCIDHQIPLIAFFLLCFARSRMANAPLSTMLLELK